MADAAAPADPTPPPKRWTVQGRDRSGLPPLTVEAASAAEAEAVYRRRLSLSGYAPLDVTEAK